MKTRARQRRAILLVEVMVLALAATLLAGVLAMMLNDAVYLQRVAKTRADYTASAQDLERMLRRDVLGAAVGTWDGSTLTLQTGEHGDREVIEYHLSTDVVRRFDEGRETHAWSATRLNFAGRAEQTPNGELFTLELVELPPPRGAPHSPRRTDIRLLLPGPTQEGGQ